MINLTATTSLIAIFIILLFGLLIFSRPHKTRSKKHNIRPSVIDGYLEDNFQQYTIKKEIAPNNTNKIYLLERNQLQYVLKITCKGIKRARREASVLCEVSAHLPTPRLISSHCKSLPGHILMTHCGTRLTDSDNTDLYFQFGKLITSVGDTPLPDSTRNLLNKNKARNIKKTIEAFNIQHPYLDYFHQYAHLPSNYFNHGDMHISQIMVQNNGDLSIIDWESAALCYRVFDLSRALGHCIKQKLSVEHAQAILAGYQSVSKLSDGQEIKLLLGLIWYDLYKTNRQWADNQAQRPRFEFVEPLLAGNTLETVFSLDTSH